MKTKEIKANNDKKGISLIVLVITIIVIIILAVAVILSIANNNPIENAKEARFRNDMKVIEEELNLYIAKKYADSLGASTVVVDLDGENMVKALPSTKDYKDKVKIVGGNLELTNSASEEEKTWAKKIGIEVEETVTLKLGDEVTYQEEPFYVIGGDTVGTEISNSTHDILLLAKYNLKKENSSITLKQDTSGAINGCVFSSAGYWSSVEGIAYPDADGKYPDLNDVKKYPIPDTDTISVIKKAQKYGNDLFGVLGRLMTKEEAIVLKKKYEGILFGDGGENNYNYWLSSAESNVFIANVCGWDGSLDYDGFDEDTTFSLDDWYGVRPVIVVPASSIN